ncbi:MAG TPA: serine/threonine dehydratase [Pseudonocardiaceae bacterium]|jgi:threonine dehydratase|nr:serine/threonine dehydratase [Pseudonocardiaceae bacterium]
MTTTALPDVTAAADRIRPYIRHTPMLDAEVDGRRVVFKLEHLQRTGSFKLRGAVNALLSGPTPDLVVTASGGNHGLAVATAARLLGLPAVVYVPETVPAGKARRIEAAGARLVRHGARYSDAAEAALAATGPGARYVPAYDDDAVVAGQGTVAAEVVADRPDVDTIAVAVGGGGLAAGTVLGAAGRPVVAVEPTDCRCLHDAIAAGRPVDVSIDSVAASALGATRIGALPFDILRDSPSVLVTDDELLAARDRLWEEFRLAVEPAAAVPFAAWLAGGVPGDLPCVILCGANTDWTPISG